MGDSRLLPSLHFTAFTPRVHALVYMLSTFHAGSDPQFVVPLLRVVLSWIGPHAETTPFEAMQQV